MSKYCTKLTFCYKGGPVLSEEEEKALKYFYLKSKKQLKSLKKIKGLAYKSCFQFVKTIKDISYNLNQISDLEEVLNYED